MSTIAVQSSLIELTQAAKKVLTPGIVIERITPHGGKSWVKLTEPIDTLTVSQNNKEAKVSCRVVSLDTGETQKFLLPIGLSGKPSEDFGYRIVTTDEVQLRATQLSRRPQKTGSLEKTRDIGPDPAKAYPKLTSERKKIIKEHVKAFILKIPSPHKSATNFGRIIHGPYEHLFYGTELIAGVNPLASLIHLNLVQDSFFRNIGIAGLAWAQGCDHMLYQMALLGSKTLVRVLQRQGIQDPAELEYAVKLYLRKRGGIVHSNLAIARKAEVIRQIAGSEDPKVLKTPFYVFHKDIYLKLISRKKPKSILKKENWYF